MSLTRKTPLRKQSAKRAAEYPRAFSTIIPKKCSGPVLKKSGKPLKARTKKRDRNDQGRILGGKYAKWIRSLPCVGCGVQGYSEAAHTSNGGMGRKADANTLVPLCGPRSVPFAREFWTGEVTRSAILEGCHRLAHRVGHRKLEKVYKVDLKAKAAELWADWQAMQGEACR